MTTLLRWWITILDNKSPAEAVVLALLWVIVAVIALFIGRGIWAIWHYTPEPEERRHRDPRPRRPESPRAAGSPSRRVS